MGIFDEKVLPSVTEAKCCECGEWYPVASLGGYWESESWEIPNRYYVHECPVCPNGGCVCDYGD